MTPEQRTLLTDFHAQLTAVAIDRNDARTARAQLHQVVDDWRPRHKDVQISGDFSALMDGVIRWHAQRILGRTLPALDLDRLETTLFPA